MPDKILIIDDEVETLRLIGLTLQRQGFQIVAANNGAQGLEVARSERPDLIILDIMMPDMDGYQVARKLRSDMDTAKTPILMFSAKAQLDDKVTGYESGADDYLTKPIHPAELVAHVKVLLARRKEHIPPPAATQGYTIGVMGAKGGLGISTLVLNLAISLQQKTKKNLIAAELNPGHGSWEYGFSEVHSKGLSNLLKLEPDKISESVVEDELFQTSYGPRLLLGSSQLKDIGLTKANAQIEKIVQQLSTLASIVLLDLGIIYWANYEKLLSLCHEIVLVSEPYQVTLERTRVLMDELDQLGFGKSKQLTIVVNNRVRSDVSLSTNQVQETLKQPVAAVIQPVPEQAYQAELMKVPLIIAHQESPVAQQFSRLAEFIAIHIQK